MQVHAQSDSSQWRKPLSRWFSIPMGVIGGGFFSAIAGFVLGFFVLMPPMSGMFGLAGEFDALWLYGIPIFASPGGAIGGLVLNCMSRRKHAFIIALVCVSIPAAAFFLFNAWGRK